MRTTRGAWALAGLLAGGAGLATSYVTANALSIRESPVVAVAEDIIRLTPGSLAEKAIEVLGHKDKPVLVAGILVFLVLVFAGAGLLARRASWPPTLVFLAVALLGALAVLLPKGSANATDALPVAVGFVTMLVVLSLLVSPLRRSEPAETPEPDGVPPVPSYGDDPSRRGFLVGAGATAGTIGLLVLVGRWVGAGRRKVERLRSLLRLTGVTQPEVPPGALVGVDEVTSWMTPADDFYRIDTTISTPVVDPTEWSLRIHGMVDRELVLSFEELNEYDKTEAWVTLNCVSNYVGGNLIGNAWWSGVRVATLLAQAGVQEGADAVLQTSDDGWTCVTPLDVLTDDRDAMLAVAMNGKPLPIEHGFPVRTLVPGLYGYVSATKWVVDLEVTRFADAQGYWTDKGWSARGPVKMSSRIDVPGSGDSVAAGEVVLAGVAWAQHTGIAGVEVAVDGGSWQAGEIADPGTDDTWVQWRAVVDVEPGDHVVRVRATDKAGLVQTGVEREPAPDGSTGWHGIDFSATS